MEPIIIEEIFDHSVDNVWQAITQVELMKQWFFKEIESFRAEVGFTTQFEVDTPNRKFLHKWRIEEVITGRKIVYDWRYPGYTGESKVTFEIIPQEDQTKLILTHVGLESFAEEGVPELSRESGLMGWKYFIQESLKRFLSEDNS